MPPWKGAFQVLQIHKFGYEEKALLITSARKGNTMNLSDSSELNFLAFFECLAE